MGRCWRGWIGEGTNQVPVNTTHRADMGRSVRQPSIFCSAILEREEVLEELFSAGG
jgi:hypothetical protein